MDSRLRGNDERGLIAPQQCRDIKHEGRQPAPFVFPSSTNQCAKMRMTIGQPSRLGHGDAYAFGTRSLLRNLIVKKLGIVAIGGSSVVVVTNLIHCAICTDILFCSKSVGRQRTMLSLFRGSHVRSVFRAVQPRILSRLPKNCTWPESLMSLGSQVIQATLNHSRYGRASTRQRLVTESNRASATDPSSKSGCQDTG